MHRKSRQTSVSVNLARSSSPPKGTKDVVRGISNVSRSLSLCNLPLQSPALSNYFPSCRSLCWVCCVLFLPADHPPIHPLRPLDLPHTHTPPTPPLSSQLTLAHSRTHSRFIASSSDHVHGHLSCPTLIIYLHCLLPDLAPFVRFFFPFYFCFLYLLVTSLGSLYLSLIFRGCCFISQLSSLFF